MILTRALWKLRRASQHLPGYVPLLRRVRGRAIPIVMYHGVTSERLRIFNWCQLSLAQFEQQLAFLSSEYRVLPLTEVLRRFESGAALPDRTACITFDDGFRNVLTTAYPVLQRHQMPATVFVVTGLVGTGQPAWPERVYQAVTTTSRRALTFNGVTWPLESDEQRTAAYTVITEQLKSFPAARKERLFSALLEDLGDSAPIAGSSPLATMDWNEIERLGKCGLVDFGSHTHSHPILARCSEQVQQDELERSRDILRDHLGSATLFAYPNGSRSDFDDVTKRLVMQAGYQCALSTVPGVNRQTTDRFELRRVNVGSDIDMATFEAAMVGL